MPNKNNLLIITSALPYANGPLHFGHLLEHIQTDIWVRTNRALNKECIYICASDAHGTPIMLKAEEENIQPEKLIEEITEIQKKSLINFNIKHDNYYTTHSEENRIFSELIFNSADKKGLIIRKKIKQLYDDSKGLFLADRYVQGECPKCGAKDQYGDNCEVCGATYEATELLNPKSIFTGNKPSVKESEHLFFDVGSCSENLKKWISDTNLQSAVENKIQEWFVDGLKPWDISRDAPYFGFKIPGYEDKYFYVWLDAPIGYIASLENYLKKKNIDKDSRELWGEQSDTEIYHFIGKDIMNFHTLFWPCMLETAGFKKPTNVFIHGFMTLNGKKMSKSKKNFLLVDDYLQVLQPDFIRYYLASKLSSGVDDLDMDLNDFQKKVNTDLIGKFINIASRSQGFLKKDSNMLSEVLDNEIIDEFINEKDNIFNLFTAREYSKALKEIMLLADKANQYIDLNKPWELNKEEVNSIEVKKIASTAINLFRVLNLYLEPVIPETSEKIKNYLKSNQSLDDLTNNLVNHQLEIFKPLLLRIEDSEIAKLAEISQNG
mgnify:FL=1